MSDRRPWAPLGHSSPALPIPTNGTASSSSQHPPRRFLHHLQPTQEEYDSFENDTALVLEDISEKPTKSTTTDLIRNPLELNHQPNHYNSRVSLEATRSTLPSRLSPHSPLNAPNLHRFHSHDVRDIPGKYPSCNASSCVPESIRPWVPFLLWLLTTLGFILAVTVWRTEVFKGLDDLSHTLQDRGAFGYSVLFFCIFLTTFPPLPLYSTFIILSGYTFGAWTGFVISYAAALTGAITVYLLSRLLLRSYITSVLNRTLWIKRVVRAIEKRPKLLFLIRVAPYPYNVMNALLAASPTLTFKTYTLCTALSLFKLIVHTTVGSTIHEFASHESSSVAHGDDDSDEPGLARAWTIVGITLCVGIFIYLTLVARKAVDELDEDDEQGLAEAGFAAGSHGREEASEERQAFLGRQMSEVELGAGIRR